MSKELLTLKERKAIEYLLNGDNQTEAVFKAFDCKNRNVARALAPRIFKKEKVALKLAEAQEKMAEDLSESVKNYIQILLKKISLEELADIHIRNLRSKDTRLSDPALDKIYKLIGAYKKEEPEQKEIGNVQIVMIKPPEEEIKRLKGEVIEKIPVIEESKVSEAKEPKREKDRESDR